MESTRQALRVQAGVVTSPTGFLDRREGNDATADRAALRVMGNPADVEECGDGGETRHAPQNPGHFRVDA